MKDLSEKDRKKAQGKDAEKDKFVVNARITSLYIQLHIYYIIVAELTVEMCETTLRERMSKSLTFATWRRTLQRDWWQMTMI